MGASASQWERFGRDDAYFGVVSQDEYRRENLDEAARARFFESGEVHAAWVLDRIRARIGGYGPRSVLDYGCGVGRVLLPLAEQAERAVGVDVSPSMLAETRRNADERGLGNIELIEAPASASLTERFDLVHCALVLQHIPVRQGRAILDQLLRLVAPEGVAVIQIPFRVSHWTGTAFSLAMRLPLAHNLVNLLGGRRWSYPYMEMNIYSVDSVLKAVLDHNMTVLDLSLERGAGGERWRYDSCWLFARASRSRTS